MHAFGLIQSERVHLPDHGARAQLLPIKHAHQACMLPIKHACCSSCPSSMHAVIGDLPWLDILPRSSPWQITDNELGFCVLDMPPPAIFTGVTAAGPKCGRTWNNGLVGGDEKWDCSPTQQRKIQMELFVMSGRLCSAHTGWSSSKGPEGSLKNGWSRMEGGNQHRINGDGMGYAFHHGAAQPCTTGLQLVMTIANLSGSPLASAWPIHSALKGRLLHSRKRLATALRCLFCLHVRRSTARVFVSLQAASGTRTRAARAVSHPRRPAHASTPNVQRTILRTWRHRAAGRRMAVVAGTRRPMGTTSMRAAHVHPTPVLSHANQIAC